MHTEITIKFPHRVTFTYKNYRGEVSVRLVVPWRWVFKSTKWHTGQQWILHGFDCNKNAFRSFAVKDITDWQPAPSPGQIAVRPNDLTIIDSEQ